MTAALHSPPGIVPGLARAWVRTYSAGMREEARAVRLIEIESDLWEHFADRSADGATPSAVGLEAFSRLLRGVPSDIAWRFQAEGLHMNIHIPLERLAGLLLLFLIVPFMAGSTLGGYSFARDGWAGEFDRFSSIDPGQRDFTGYFHAFVGLALVATAAMFFAMLRERSPRLVTLGAGLLTAGGVVMLMNAAVYRAMSALAEDYAATGDQSILATARALGVGIETLSIANMAATVFGVLALSTALTRLAMIPRWTAALPLIATAGLLSIFVVAPFSDGAEWGLFMLGFACVGLWLLICGSWLLFGGSTHLPSMKGIPAHTG